MAEALGYRLWGCFLLDRPDRKYEEHLEETPQLAGCSTSRWLNFGVLSDRCLEFFRADVSGRIVGEGGKKYTSPLWDDKGHMHPAQNK